MVAMQPTKWTLQTYSIVRGSCCLPLVLTLMVITPPSCQGPVWALCKCGYSLFSASSDNSIKVGSAEKWYTQMKESEWANPQTECWKVSVLHKNALQIGYSLLVYLLSCSTILEYFNSTMGNSPLCGLAHCFSPFKWSV